MITRHRLQRRMPRPLAAAFCALVLVGTLTASVTDANATAQSGVTLESWYAEVAPDRTVTMVVHTSGGDGLQSRYNGATSDIGYDCVIASTGAHAFATAQALGREELVAPNTYRTGINIIPEYPDLLCNAGLATLYGNDGSIFSILTQEGLEAAGLGLQFIIPGYPTEPGLIAVSPSSGFTGTRFTAKYSCAGGFVPSVTQADGQPAVGATLELPVTGDSRNYVQVIELNMAGVFVFHVLCGSQEIQSPNIVVAPTPALCKDAALIGARGSGDSDFGTSHPGEHAIEIARLMQSEWGIGLYDADGGAAGVIGLTYPAVAVPVGLPGYDSSVSTGEDNLLSDVRLLREACGPRYPILLTGFSQGAHVIQSLLEKLDDMASQGDQTWRSIAGVALLASPRFSPDDPGARGTFAADYPTPGLAGGAVIRDRFKPITRTYCLNRDVVCVQGPSLGRHTDGYDPGTATGRPILRDAAALLAFGMRSRNGGSIAPSPTGSIEAYNLERGKIILSAGTIYANGAPTSSFRWDLNGDGISDVNSTSASPLAFLTYNSGGLLRATNVTAWIKFVDGSEMSRCIRLTAFGLSRCKAASGPAPKRRIPLL